MNIIKFVLLFFITILIQEKASCANRYWIGGTGNWNTPSNWAPSSGAPTDNILPTSSDYVYFDINSGTGTVTVNTNNTIYQLDFLSGCSNITLDIAANTLTVTSYYYHSTSSTNATTLISGGTLTAGDISLYAGVFNANAGIVNVTGTSFGNSGASVSIAGAILNIGNSTNEYLRVWSGTLNFSSGTINTTGYFYIDNGGFTMSGGILNSGTGLSPTYWATIYISGTNAISNGTINVQSVQSGQYATYIYTGTAITGGLIKLNATNTNYSIKLPEAYNLEINSSGRTATLGSNVNITGDLAVTAGAFTYTSTYSASFIGTAPQTISGTAATGITFYGLTLNNVNGLTIAPASGIATTVRYLTLTNGKITLGNYSLNIGTSTLSGSITGGNSSNYIITNGTGALRQYRIGSTQRTSAFYPIGYSSTSYTPITLATSGTSTGDHFSINVSPTVYTNGTSGSPFTSYCVDRTWNITEGTAGGSSVTISPQWNGSDELTLFDRSIAYIGHYTGASWSSEVTGSTTGSNPYTCTSGPITSFSPFAIFSPIPLPIDMLYYKVEKKDRDVLVSWTVENEVNCDYYEIKKSSDGFNFIDIEQVNQQGNPSIVKTYSITDNNPFQGISYYQLNQYDTDGIMTYSEIRSVEYFSESYSNLFPNPITNGKFNLVTSNLSDIVTVSIIDNTGKLIYNQTITQNENPIITFDLGDQLANGIYHLQINDGNIKVYHKFYVQQ